MIVTPEHQQAYRIAVRMEEIFEAREEAGTLEGYDRPWCDDEVRAQAHRELGIPDD